MKFEHSVWFFFCRVIRQQQEIDDLAAKQTSDTSTFYFLSFFWFQYYTVILPVFLKFITRSIAEFARLKDFFAKIVKFNDTHV